MLFLHSEFTSTPQAYHPEHNCFFFIPIDSKTTNDNRSTGALVLSNYGTLSSSYSPNDVLTDIQARRYTKP